MSYLATILADSPELVLPLGEASGTLFDATANGHDGAATGGTSFIYGQPGLLNTEGSKCVSLYLNQASASYVDVPRQANINDLTNGFSVEAWVNPSIATGIAVISMGHSSGGGGWAASIHSSTQWSFTTFGILDYVSGATVINPGSIYHVVWVFDTSNNVTFYVNGVKIGNTITGASPSSSSADDFRIGTSGIGTSQYKGYAQYVALYKSVLSGAQALTHYQAGMVAQQATALPPQHLAFGTLGAGVSG